MSDPWSPSPSTAQEFPAAPQTAADATAAALKRIAEQARDGARNLLRSAGITVAETLMTISRGLRVEGDLTSTGTATLGGNTDVTGALDVSGSMTVGGTMVVTGDATFEGDLAVPNGSITNDALASPVTGRSGNASVGSVTFGTTLGAYATVTIAVPAGFTRAEVLGVSSLFCGSSTPNAAALRTRIATVDGEQMTVTTDPNFANGASSHARSLSGLVAGSNVVVQTMVQQAAGATMSGGCTTSAIVTFYR